VCRQLAEVSRLASAVAGMDSPPELRNCVGMPPDPFDKYENNIKIIINTYTNKEII
jgi:hypothetical protein